MNKIRKAPRGIKVTLENIDFILGYAKECEKNLDYLWSNVEHTKDAHGWDTYLATSGDLVEYNNVTFTEFGEPDFRHLWEFAEKEDPARFCELQRVEFKVDSDNLSSEEASPPVDFEDKKRLRSDKEAEAKDAEVKDTWAEEMTKVQELVMEVSKEMTQAQAEAKAVVDKMNWSRAVSVLGHAAVSALSLHLEGKLTMQNGRDMVVAAFDLEPREVHILVTKGMAAVTAYGRFTVHLTDILTKAFREDEA